MIFSFVLCIDLWRFTFRMLADLFSVSLPIPVLDILPSICLCVVFYICVGSYAFFEDRGVAMNEAMRQLHFHTCLQALLIKYYIISSARFLSHIIIYACIRFIPTTLQLQFTMDYLSVPL